MQFINSTWLCGSNSILQENALAKNVSLQSCRRSNAYQWLSLFLSSSGNLTFGVVWTTGHHSILRLTKCKWGGTNKKPGRFSSALALSELRQNSSRWWASYNDGACQQILCEFCPQRKETKLLPKKSSKHNVLNLPATFKPKYRKFCQISFQFKILDVSDTCRLDEGSLLFLSRQLMARKFSPTSLRPCIAKDCSKDGCGEVGEDYY